MILNCDVKFGPRYASLVSGTFGQCGVDAATKASMAEVQCVATMDRPAQYEHLDIGESIMYPTSALNFYGLPFDFDSLREIEPPVTCPCMLQRSLNITELPGTPSRPPIHLAVAHGQMRGRWAVPTST